MPHVVSTVQPRLPKEIHTVHRNSSFAELSTHIASRLAPLTDFLGLLFCGTRLLVWVATCPRSEVKTRGERRDGILRFCY
jgi:hypothetical protein